MGDAGPRGGTERRAPARLPVLLRWGLPRDPKATEHILGFVLTTVLTIVVTRAYLQATGFPQIGGGGLHVAHVLWGGLAMAIAVVLALSFAGPVVRPFVAFFGGIGFGLFIDEVGKFLTDDNDYFFRPAPMIMYATLVVLVLAADVLHGRRPHHPTEHLAAAADQAVSGLAGGLSPRRRAFAEEQLARARDVARRAGDAPARGEAETTALLRAVPHDEDEAPDPVTAVAFRLRAAFAAVASRRRATWLIAPLLVLLVAVSAVGVLLELGDDVRWAPVAAGVTLLVTAVLVVVGWWRLRRDRYRALRAWRRAVLVNVLLTQVAVYRVAPWWATAAVVVAVLALGVIAAEKARLERAGLADGRLAEQR